MKRIILLMVLTSLIVELTGCWNSRELTDMSIVVGMGVDTVPDSDDYSVSFQIVNASAMSATVGSVGGTGALPIVTYSSQGDTIFSALRKASRNAPRRLFFGHVQLVVIGEDAARRGIDDLLDFFERSHEVRLSSAVLIARESTAENIISIITPLEKIPSIGLSRRSRITSSIWGESAYTNVKDVINQLVGPGEPIIGGIQLLGDRKLAKTDKNLKNTQPPSKVQVEGISLLKNGKLNGWLDDHPARGVLWIRNEMKGTVINFPCNPSKGQRAVVVVRSKTDVQPRMQDGKPKFLIHVKEEGFLAETNCTLDLVNRQAMLEIQDQWIAQTKKDIHAAVKAAQEAESDILGFGTSLQEKLPKQWKAVENHWTRTFAESEVDIQVEAYIRRAGMRGDTFQKKIKDSE